MNRRYRIYAGAIALLAVINVGHWVMHGATEERTVSERTMLAEDFRLRVDVPSGAGHERDLFASAGAGVGREHPGGSGFRAGGRLARRPAAKIAAMAPLSMPAPASAPDPAQLMAQSGLSRLRLLGVVFHAGKHQAYLAQDNQNCIAATGDTVFGQYAVDQITVDAVQLRDTKTNMTRRIPVSGK